MFDFPYVSQKFDRFFQSPCNCQKHQNYLVTSFQHHVIHVKLIFIQPRSQGLLRFQDGAILKAE